MTLHSNGMGGVWLTCDIDGCPNRSEQYPLIAPSLPSGWNEPGRNRHECAPHNGHLPAENPSARVVGSSPMPTRLDDADLRGGGRSTQVYIECEWPKCRAESPGFYVVDGLPSGWISRSVEMAGVVHEWRSCPRHAVADPCVRNGCHEAAVAGDVVCTEHAGAEALALADTLTWLLWKARGAGLTVPSAVSERITAAIEHDRETPDARGARISDLRRRLTKGVS